MNLCLASFDVSFSTSINFALSGIAFAFLLGGVFIQEEKRESNRKYMVRGLVVSAIVLAAAVIYQIKSQETVYSGDVRSESEGSVKPKGDKSLLSSSASIERGEVVFHPELVEVIGDPGLGSVEVCFTVSNHGQKPLQIDSMESTCACLSVTVDRNPIPPSSEATITGLFDISKLKGTSDKLIKVFLTGETRSVDLIARIAIKEIYTIEADLTQWRVNEEPNAKTVEFRVLRDRPIHLLAAESNRSEMKAEIIELEPGRAYDLKLTPQSTAQSMLGIVRIETDCEIESYARPLTYFMIQ